MADSSSDFSQSLDDSAAVELTGKIMVATIIVLFLVVVFVLFLHLYAKLRTEQRDDPASINSPFGTRLRRRRRFIFVPGHQQEPAAGLDPSVIRSLPVLIFHPQDFKDELECAVCLCEIAEGEKARLLPKCNHGFHVDCIDMWLITHSTCPLCRNLIASDPSSLLEEETTETNNQHQQPSASEDFSSTAELLLNYPTNVLFWGNETQVSSGALCSEVGPSSQRGPRAELVVDIPRLMTDNLSSSSPSSVQPKSPMTPRIRSLKRLLSRDKRSVPSSPTSTIDIEQPAPRQQ